MLEALPEKFPLAYNSVLTTIRILEKKGYVQHVKEGRAHVYAPLVGKQEATRYEIKNLVGRFFKNSHELLVLNILEDKNINAEELKRLSQLLQEPKGEAMNFASGFHGIAAVGSEGLLYSADSRHVACCLRVVSVAAVSQKRILVQALRYGFQPCWRRRCCR